MKKNEGIRVGAVLIADAYAGFPDMTTQGKAYTITRVDEYVDRVQFFIVNDEGDEVLPISTVFSKA